MKILLIKLSSLGDILHSTAIIKSLSKINNIEIDFVIDKKYISIVDSIKAIKNLFLYDEDLIAKYLKKLKIFKIFSYFRSIIKEIRKTKYDIVFDLQGIEKSLLFYFYSKAIKKYCKWSLPYKSLSQNKTEHAIDVMYYVVKKAFPEIAYSSMIDLSAVSNSEIKFKECVDILGITEKQSSELVVISAFTRWKTKDWPLIYYFIIAVYLVEKEYTPLFIGSDQDLKVYSDFCKLLDYALNFNIREFENTKNNNLKLEQLFTDNFQYYISNNLKNPEDINNYSFLLRKPINDKFTKIITKENMLELLLNFYYSLHIVTEKCKDAITNLWGNRIDTIEKLYNVFTSYSKSNQIINAIDRLNPGDIPIIMKKSKLFIGSDSFNFHVSQSTSTRSIVFFGPTSLKRVGPLNKSISEIKSNSDLDCLECYKRICPKKLNNYMACMYGIIPIDVIYCI